MKNLIIVFTVLLSLTACTPSLYLTMENHSGGFATVLIHFNEDNEMWKAKAGETKEIDFETTAIFSVIEYNFGSGAWTEEKLDEVTKGITIIEFITRTGSLKIEDQQAIHDLFANNITGDHNNGILIKVQ